jgi:hypothetical protein
MRGAVTEVTALGSDGSLARAADLVVRVELQLESGAGASQDDFDIA